MRNVNLANVDLNLLVALEVLLHERHLTKTAERLQISQPSMSRLLARLRKLFDDPLIVRTANGYVKTPRADELETQISTALSAIQLALAAPNFDPVNESGVFRICTTDYGEAVVIPPLIRLLRESAPNMEIEIVRATVFSTTEIQEGDADVSLGIMPKGSTKNCIIEPLFSDRFVCVMCKDHPAASKKLTMETYLSYGHSLIETVSKPGNGVDEMLQPSGSRRTIVKRSPFFLASLYSLPGTDLIQLTAKRLVEPMLKPLNLIMKDLPFHSEPAHYCMTWHVRNDATPSHQWLRKQIMKAAKTVKQG